MFARSTYRTVVLLLVAASPLTAQSVAGVYRVFQGDKEIGREQFERDQSHFTQIANIPPINARLESTNRRDASGKFAGFTLAVRNLAGDSLRGSYQIERAGDSALITSDLPGSKGPTTHAANFDAVMPPQSVSMLAELLLQAGGRDTSWRVLVAGANTVITANVYFAAGDSARVVMPGITVYAIIRNGLVQSLEIPAQGAHAVLVTEVDTLKPLATPNPRPTPVYTAPPGAIYTAEEVRVPVKPIGSDTFSLGCTLTVPKASRRPVPAIVTITGSGSQGRDEDLWPLLPGYGPFRQVAEHLARAGMATLRCDDRGKDGSTGDASDATTADFAGDTKAQIAWLRTRPEINGDRIGLVGHSEGGIIGPLIAAYDPRLRGIVLLAGPGKPGVDILIDQAQYPVTADKQLTDAERSTRLVEAEAGVRADSAANGAWYRWFYRYDPLPIAERVKQPALILHGALDRQVSRGQADTLAAAIRKGGNRDVTVRVYPGLNHLFLPSKADGAPSEYASLKDVMVPTAVLDTLALWLRQRLVLAR